MAACASVCLHDHRYPTLAALAGIGTWRVPAMLHIVDSHLLTLPGRWGRGASINSLSAPPPHHLPPLPSFPPRSITRGPSGFSPTSPCQSVDSALLYVHVNMVLNDHRNHKAYQGREKGGGKGFGRGGGNREIIYVSLHCHHQNGSGIKVGSDESHFNVSLIVRDSVTRSCPQTTIFKEKGEPMRIRTEVSLLTSLTPCR